MTIVALAARGGAAQRVRRSSSRASTHPLLPLRVVADRARGGSFLALGITGIALFAVFLFLTYYLQLTKGFSPIETGLAFLPMTAAIIDHARRSANIVFLAKVGPRPLLVLGMTLGALAMVWFAQLDTDVELRRPRAARPDRARDRDGQHLRAGDRHRDLRRRPARTPASPPRW